MMLMAERLATQWKHTSIVWPKPDWITPNRTVMTQSSSPTGYSSDATIRGYPECLLHRLATCLLWHMCNPCFSAAPSTRAPLLLVGVLSYKHLESKALTWQVPNSSISNPTHLTQL